MKILLIASASVSLPIAWKIKSALAGKGYHVDMMMTKNAWIMANTAVKHLGSSNGLGVKIQNADENWRDKSMPFEDEICIYESGKGVWHVDAANEYDVLVVAPATADIIGKIANGISGEPVLDAVTAFIGTKKPVYIAPSMNVHMWENVIVQRNLEKFNGTSIKVIWPTVKKLACGDYGIGALADAHTIANIVEGKRWGIPIDLEFLKKNTIFFKYDPDDFFLHQEFLNRIPTWEEPGSFGFLRKYNVHEGVDLYCPEGTSVYAVEDGKVVDQGQFTGQKLGHPWWNDTDYVAVQGDSGVVIYGEIQSTIPRGSFVKKGDRLGTVLTVCKNAPHSLIRNHMNSMLHVELYQDPMQPTCLTWTRNEKGYNERPGNLLDPTPYLKLIE